MEDIKIPDSEKKESFRESLNIVGEDGKRNFIYPKKPKGRFYNFRNIFTVFLLAFLIGTPFIKISGHPFMLFDVTERKFILFGLLFGPHDFYLFVLVMIAFIVFIFLFTAVFGRVFCGWACPQTVFLEMVFRKIEYFIEGDYLSQKRLSSAPWNTEKILKKFAKWFLFALVSVIISNILIAWIIGTDELAKMISEPINRHQGSFIAMALFSITFYFIFAWFREYACIYVCPYGRLQGVLLDPNSIVIAYDDPRGEPRGKLKKGRPGNNGDCIDCKECVVVCPTGIDIRNGTQLECVNCTACIDACDNVMDKINKPRGLIRFASSDMIKKRTGFRLTTRVTGYSALLVVLTAVLTLLLFNRQPVDVTILRTPGLTYQVQPNDIISNLYSIKFTNKTFDKINIDIKLENSEGEIKVIGTGVILEPNAVSETKFLVLIPKDKLSKMNTPLVIGVYMDNEKLNDYKSTFLGPAGS